MTLHQIKIDAVLWMVWFGVYYLAVTNHKQTQIVLQTYIYLRMQASLVYATYIQEKESS